MTCACSKSIWLVCGSLLLCAGSGLASCGDPYGSEGGASVGDAGVIDVPAEAGMTSDAAFDTGATDGSGNNGDAAGPLSCLAKVQQLFSTSDRQAFLAAFPGAKVIDFSRLHDGSKPTAGSPFDQDEYLSEGVRIRLANGPAGASLIWTGNTTSGFSVSASCLGGPGMCTADIVVELTLPQRAAGFDYPGNVRAIWKQPSGTLIRDTGDIAGSGDNFVGLSSDAPIGSITLVRPSTNSLSGVVFAGCPPL